MFSSDFVVYTFPLRVDRSFPWPKKKKRKKKRTRFAFISWVLFWFYVGSGVWFYSHKPLFLVRGWGQGAIALYCYNHHYYHCCCLYYMASMIVFLFWGLFLVYCCFFLLSTSNFRLLILSRFFLIPYVFFPYNEIYKFQFRYDFLFHSIHFTYWFLLIFSSLFFFFFFFSDFDLCLLTERTGTKCRAKVGEGEMGGEGCVF